jgi:hypothetical protein
LILKTGFSGKARHPGMGFVPVKVQSGVWLWRMSRASLDGVFGADIIGKVRRLKRW